MKFRYAMFDLDGTLTDPAEGITNSIRYALRKLGEPVPEREQLYPFIGPPLLDSFEKYCGLSPERSHDALIAYREYFVDRGIFENEVYPGIEALLQTLSAAGIRLFVATSKPELYSVRILEHFGLSKYFEFVGGCTMEEQRVKKDEVIRYILEQRSIPDGENAVMIGDRGADMIGAKKCGLSAIGALYGYGSREELADAGADFFAEAPERIGKIILMGKD